MYLQHLTDQIGLEFSGSKIVTPHSQNAQSGDILPTAIKRGTDAT